MRLKRWYLSFVDNKVFAWGEVFDSPKFASGAFIHTNFSQGLNVSTQFSTLSTAPNTITTNNIYININNYIKERSK